MVVSPQLLAELDEVLHREKFRRWITVSEAERFIDQVWAIAEVVHDAPQPWPVVSRDPKDDYLAALARAAVVDAIISGDGDLTSLVKLVPTVFTPAGFLALINEGP